MIVRPVVSIFNSRLALNSVLEITTETLTICTIVQNPRVTETDSIGIAKIAFAQK